jgi:methionyl-tRNA formyltransferase
MIDNNKFFIKNLKSVVFLGENKNLTNFININKSLNIETLVITTSSQKLKIDKSINYKVFDKINDDFKNFIKKSLSIKNTLFISIAARYIFKKDTIKNFFLNNLVNIHNARLPLDSGGGGYSWKILREDRIDNQTIHLIDEKIDHGPIIFNISSVVPKGVQTPLDFDIFSEKNLLKLYEKFIYDLSNEVKFNLKNQIDYIGRYNPRLNSEINGSLDWNLEPHDLINFINAFDDPYCGASTYLNNGKFGKLYLKNCQLHGGDSSNHPFMTGLVTRHDKSWIVVSTKGKYMLLVEKVLNRKNENIISKIKVGDRFYTSQKDFFKSFSKRFFYNSKGIKQVKQ